MKLSFQSPSSRAQRQCGITLIECLVYIGVFAVVFGMGTAAFYRCMENSAAMRRNTDDITQALHTGELWRADIRAAVQTPVWNDATRTLQIIQRDTEVFYRFAENKIERRTAVGNEWQLFLPRVAQSTMTSDPRRHATAWRWELELKPQREPALVRPLFTFTATTTLP